jgi:CHASE2 domain-containing sensor protein
MGQWSWLGLSALGSTAVVLGLQFGGAFQFLELVVLDRWFRWRPIEPIDPRIVLVTINEKDIAKNGQYPITDGTLATILTKIRQQQPRVIGLDLYRNLPIEPGHQALKAVFASTPNLIGVEKTVGGDQAPAVDPPPVLRSRDQIAAGDLVLDSDGRVRRGLLAIRVPPMWGRQQRTVQTLGMRLALEYLKGENIRPKKIPEKGQQFQLGRARLVQLEKDAGGYVHADVGGFQILSNFRHFPQRLPSISITDVLQDKIPTGFMRDRIVLIGATADSLNDRFLTPFTVNTQTIWAGVEVHADLASQLISAALEGRPLLRGIPAPMEGVWILLWSGIGTAFGIGVRLSPRIAWLILVWVSAMVAGVYGLFLLGWWLTIVAPLVAMTIAGIFSHGHLIWQQLKTSHHLLQDYAKTLEQKVKDRTQELIQQNIALERAKQEAELANQAKNTFLANINHELRTPLSIILSSSELISYDASLTPKQQDRLGTINQSVQHLLDLINNVLEISKLEAEAEILDLETVSLKNLLQGLETMFYPQAAMKGLTLVLDYAADLPEWVTIDERKFRQVLINLLNNAIKFTQEGTVTLRVFYALRSVSQTFPVLRFEVEDTGVGIASEEMDLLFKAFMQTESGRKSGKGTGLGLSISYHFVQLMGSELKVNSAPGVGTIFWFELPMQLSAITQSAMEAQES